jgi:RNA polymerase sigma factor (sigma-70 family)
LRVARAHSLCADDAEDAVQRSLEIYMRRAESLDPATELAWLKVVVKHEAMAVRRARAGVASEEVDLDAVPAPAQRSVEERLESAERVRRSAEVMRRLKRDEARALMLKAEGLSYLEIGERLGWTYTKVNRCITEGRRRFLKLYEELETGAECERLAPTLVALASGTASSDALLEIRPHLRNCPACRATVRELHASALRRLTSWLPLAAIVEPARGLFERARGPKGSPPVELHPLERGEQVEEAIRRMHAGEAAAQPVVPTVVEHAGRLSSMRVNLRGWVEAASQRVQSSDLALGVHAATSGGGGRVGALAALIGICVSGVGAGTYCVTTALLPDRRPPLRAEASAGGSAAAKRKAHESKPASLPRRVSSVATPVPTRVPEQKPRPKPRATPKAHEQTPISPAQAATQDFSFEQQASDPGPVTPAAAPSTGGGEFEP